MTVFSQIAMLLLLALCAMVFLLLLKNSSRSSSGGSRFFDSAKSRSFFLKANHAQGTVLIPKLYVEQLNPETMESVHRFSISSIPENGVTISRPNAKEGGIILSSATREAYTVSENHARIGEDEQGMFLQDLMSHNKMYQQGSRQAVDEVDIVNGTVVYLGMQPLKFIIPALRTRAEDENGGQEERHGTGISQIYEKTTGNANTPIRRRGNKK